MVVQFIISAVLGNSMALVAGVVGSSYPEDDSPTKGVSRSFYFVF